MALHQIIYISSADVQLTEETLLEILSSSQKRNAQRGITGLLLHAEGNIIQVIEGQEGAVTGLYQKISRDPRHHRITLISSRPIRRRDFPEFKMGFKRAKAHEVEAQIPGFTDMVEKRHISDEQLAGLSKLVATFIRTFAKVTRIDHIE